MRSPSDDLFRLIKTLNKGEKRAFKKLAGCKSGEKKYIDLFDQIDRLDLYDEDKLRRKVTDGTGFSSSKNYLFRSLLRSLAYWDSNPHTELSRLLDQARVLMAKDLYHQALKVLRKGARLARKLEAYSVLHNFLDQQMKLLPRIPQVRSLGPRMAELHAAKREARELLQNLDEYAFLWHRCQLLMNTRNRVRRPEDRRELEDILSHPLLQNPTSARSTRARIHFLTVHRMMASYQNLPGQAQHFSQQLIDIYRENDGLLLEGLQNFYSELTNQCIYTIRNQNYPRVWELIDEFKSFREIFPQGKVEHFQSFSLLVLGYSLRTGDLDRALEVVDQIELDIRNFREQLTFPQLFILQYYLAQLFFLAGQYSDCLRCINSLLAEPKSDYRIDLQGYCRVLRLMVYFELENYLACESDLPNVQRFLERNNSYQKFETVIFKILRYMIKKAGLYSDKVIFTNSLDKFKHELAGSNNDKTDKYLNFGIWLESKARKITPSHLLMEEANFPVKV